MKLEVYRLCGTGLIDGGHLLLHRNRVEKQQANTPPPLVAPISSFFPLQRLFWVPRCFKYIRTSFMALSWKWQSVYSIQFTTAGNDWGFKLAPDLLSNYPPLRKYFGGPEFPRSYYLHSKISRQARFLPSACSCLVPGV